MQRAHPLFRWLGPHCTSQLSQEPQEPQPTLVGQVPNWGLAQTWSTPKEPTFFLIKTTVFCFPMQQLVASCCAIWHI